MTHNTDVLAGTLTAAIGTPDIIGSAAWADDDDATLAVLRTDWTGDETTSTIDRVTAPLAILTGTATSGTTILAHLRCYCQILTGGASPPPDAQLLVAVENAFTGVPYLQVGDTAAPSGAPAFFWSIPASTSGIPMFDHTIDLGAVIGAGTHYAAWSTSRDAMIAALEGTGMEFMVQIDFRNSDPVTKWEVGIAKLWLEVTELEDVVVPGAIPTVPGLAPLRVFPREDGLATSTVRRNFPVPKSYQASNRRGGAYL